MEEFNLIAYKILFNLNNDFSEKTNKTLKNDILGSLTQTIYEKLQNKFIVPYFISSKNETTIEIQVVFENNFKKGELIDYIIDCIKEFEIVGIKLVENIDVQLDIFFLVEFLFEKNKKFLLDGRIYSDFKNIQDFSGKNNFVLMKRKNTNNICGVYIVSTFEEFEKNFLKFVDI